MALQNNFDVLTFSEPWFNSSVTDASVELEGYKLYRLDSLGKIGTGVCAYIKITLKAEIVNDLICTDQFLAYTSSGFKSKARNGAPF